MKPEFLESTSLASFILTARNYCLNNQVSIDSNHQASREISYGEENFVYKKSFLGLRNLIGKEIVFLNGEPIWGMSFMGTTSNDKFKQNEILRLLNSVLLSTFPNDKSNPGHIEYSSDEIDEGDITHFKGEKIVILKMETVFKLQYFGGTIMGNH